MKRLSILLLMLLCATICVAQSTRVRGRVTDKEGNPLSFASVVFKGTTVGMMTDEEGLFSLETREAVDTLQVMMMGYISQERAVKRAAYSEHHFKLQTADFAIDQVVVTPGENPAFPILDRVIERKKRNNPDHYDSYTTETYTKMELGLTNIKEEFKNKRMQRNFGFIFEYVDTSALTGRRYLPAMISETKADYYHALSPSVDREVIRANRVSGVEDTFSIAQFTGQMPGNVNFYHNFIDIFNVRFASPLADGGRMFYNYFLIDSLEIEGRKSYKIRFHPRSLASPVLDGEMHIDAESYALKNVSARLPRRSNINWIKHLLLENENEPVDSLHWMRRRDRVQAEFTISMRDSSKLTSFIGTREVAYRNTRIGVEIPEEVLRMDNNVYVEAREEVQDDAFWNEVRPYALSEREQGIYHMVDSIQRAPLYRNIYTTINMFIVGHYNTKYIGIGPYYKLASFNDLEGFRPQLGGRTTANFSRRVRLSAYGAYGTKDERWKGGAGAELVFGKRLTRKLTIRGAHDVMQLGAGANALTESNILSSIFSRGDQRLSMVDRGEIQYEHEWIHGVSTFLTGQMRRIYSNRYVPMALPGDEVRLIESVDDASVSVGVRLSKNEKIYRSAFDKNSLGSIYPILTLSATAGLKNVLRDSPEYYRVDGSIFYRPELPPLGHSEIMLQAGQIWGDVPYPLLKLHEGNGTYFYDPYAFSCMDYYEFASDRWVACFFEHHFGGVLLGKIPLLKRLKLREVLVAKGVWGTLSEQNDGSATNTPAPLRFPVGLGSVSKPYFEAGFGIENIFRLVRVDFIWRLSHREAVPGGPKPQNFSINASLHLDF
ncbi:MAG: carboxypeptidase-like regulatory domain-containing protein [Alistipes sp.]|nr:carboxypeptidase-like regulatory domain-containing protein [Alistipes sp.]